DPFKNIIRGEGIGSVMVWKEKSGVYTKLGGNSYSQLAQLISNMGYNKAVDFEVRTMLGAEYRIHFSKGM
ncbi:hypothetical protein, partial [Bacillus sp. JJ722]|uniref:hypothetical protein n=1 Tax=Bacillus sp. JJ722 TaxID=3122973 RepID=UPI002FFE3728